MKFQRIQRVVDFQSNGRVVIIYGPRRVGKTTLVKKYLEENSHLKTIYELGDDLVLQEKFKRQSRAELLDYARSYDIIVIDEAQNIKNIGIVAKIIIDEFPEKKIVLTGSSSFELSQSVGEPLVGRQFFMNMLPVAWSEFGASNFEKQKQIHNLLIYGSYPEILLEENDLVKEQKLRELISSYLFKDILALDKIKYPSLLLKVVQALAYQVGSEVSVHKLAKDVDEKDSKIIKRYLDILEKTFVIKKVGRISNNLRNQIKKPHKYYFYDLGVRNAVINRFQTLDFREGKEIGALWENFVFMELNKKSNLDKKDYEGFFFWQNKNKLELDIVKKSANDQVFAYECKWKDEGVVFTKFLEEFPTAKCAVINKENIADFL